MQSLAVDFHAYTGDRSYIDLVRHMLDHELTHGTTPADWQWAQVPYASGDPGGAEYDGATRWEAEGMRGDGLHGIEPDKIGELGVGYLKYHEITGEAKSTMTTMRFRIARSMPPARRSFGSRTALRTCAPSAVSFSPRPSPAAMVGRGSRCAQAEASCGYGGLLPRRSRWKCLSWRNVAVRGGQGH